MKKFKEQTKSEAQAGSTGVVSLLSDGQIFDLNEAADELTLESVRVKEYVERLSDETPPRIKHALEFEIRRLELLAQTIRGITGCSMAGHNKQSALEISV